VEIEDKKTKGLYDPGANISIIPLHFLNTLKNNIYVPSTLKFGTMSGEERVIGITYLKIKIFDVTKEVKVFVINKDNYKYGLLMGLDIIKSFRLCQDHNLKITQARPEDDMKAVKNFGSHNRDMDSTAIIATAVNGDRKILEGKMSVNWNEHIPFDKFEAKTSHLDSEKKQRIHDFIEKYSSVFAKHQFDVGTVNGYEAHIKLIEDRYVAKKPYRCSYEDQEEIEKQVTELLKQGLIEESCSPFASPVTLAYKKTGEDGKKEKNRLCIDFRNLNKLLLPESQPFPLIEDIIGKTRDCEWFSAIDINSAFWSIPIRPEDRHKTGFVTQHGHWQWVSMPFGLKNAPAIFQRILSGIIRRNNLSEFSINYLDDILIFSRTFEEHMKHLELLVEAIIREGFRLKFVKCNFATNSVHYLGHIISKNSIRPLNDNLISIKNFPVPQNRKNVRQFLGKINFYHKFISNAASILDVFHNLLRKNVPFVWTTECQNTFEQIKKYLTSSPVLEVFDRERPIIIYTDASGVGIGAVLKQSQADGTEKPVAYFSKKLSECQKKKKAIYIESLAIREAIKYWRYWLVGRKFTVITDHKPLENLNLKSRTDEELGDLANYLLQYDFDVIYRSGSRNGEADCLSRNPVLDSNYGKDVLDILPTINLLELEDIRMSQKNITFTNNDNITDGVVVRKLKGGRNRILLDTEYGKRLIDKVHIRYGHIGTKHVYNTIRRYFYFDKMYVLIREYCASCTVCIKNKSRKGRESGMLGHFGPATKPYEIMSLDTVGGFGGRRSTKRYLHLLEDQFTRYVYISTSSNQDANQFIKLIKSVQQEHQIGTLLTDQYGGLKSNEFTDYLQEANIVHCYTAVDSPASNGLIERLNQTLVNRIRCITNENNGNGRKAWTTVARQCIDQYNATIHSVTQFSPNYLMYGILTDMVPKKFLEIPDLLADRCKAFDNSMKNHEQNKRRYDKNRKSVFFRVGDRVFIENGNKLNRHKLDEIRIGPYPVVRKISNSIYEIDVGHKSCSKRLYHVSKIVKIDFDESN
jgi:hypothetical protein